MGNLKITDVNATLESNNNQTVLQNINLSFLPNTINVIMGPNGSGKSSLAKAIIGDPSIKVESGTISLNNEDISKLAIEERARKGIFLGFQNPKTIPGVSSTQFLRQAISQRNGVEDFSVLEVRMQSMNWTSRLGFKQDFLSRNLNEGFSGGEKKRNELLQMALLKPEIAILDEIDSGLDIKGCEQVAYGIKEIFKENPQMSLILITHYQRITNMLDIDNVHILIDGKVVESGEKEILPFVEKNGFSSFRKKMV